MERRSDEIAVTVDLIAFTRRHDELNVVLVQRKHHPFQGGWALPGGFLEIDEDLAEAASREMLEETGLNIPPSRLTQVGAYGTPGRDPRMRTVTVAFAAFQHGLEDPNGSDDAAAARLWPVVEVLANPDFLAFDHFQILTDAMTALGLAAQA